MLNYILAFALYFGGTLLLAELITRHKKRKQNTLDRAKWLRKWAARQELDRINFLMKTRKEN